MYSNPRWRFQIHDKTLVAAYLLSSKSRISAIRVVDVANSNRTYNRTFAQNFRWSLFQSSNTVIEPKYHFVNPSAILWCHCSSLVERSNRNKGMCQKIIREAVFCPSLINSPQPEHWIKMKICCNHICAKCVSKWIVPYPYGTKK